MLYALVSDLGQKTLFVRIIGLPSDQASLERNINAEINRLAQNTWMCVSLFNASLKSAHYGLVKKQGEFWGHASGWLFRKESVLSHNNESESFHADGDLGSYRFIGPDSNCSHEDIQSIKSKINENNTFGKIGTFEEIEQVFIKNPKHITEHVLKVNASDIEGILVDIRGPLSISQALLLHKRYQEQENKSLPLYVYNHEVGSLYQVDQAFLTEKLHEYYFKDLIPGVIKIEFLDFEVKIEVVCEKTQGQILSLSVDDLVSQGNLTLVSKQPLSKIYRDIVALFEKRIESVRAAIVENYIDNTGVVTLELSHAQLVHEQTVKFNVRQLADGRAIVSKYKAFNPISGVSEQTSSFPGYISFDKRAVYYKHDQVLESLNSFNKKRSTVAATYIPSLLDAGESDPDNLNNNPTSKKIKLLG